MADDRIRQLERQAAQGDADAEARLLLERVRLGELPRARLELLARAGDPLASRAVGGDRVAQPAGDDAALFTLRVDLAAAIVWCTEGADPDRPASSLRRLGARVLDYTTPPRERVAEVAALCQERARALRPQGWVEQALAQGLAGGRLLLFDFDGTLSDGAAARESHRFFDDHNCPPWDTWLRYVSDGLPPGFWRNFRSYVACYVPPQLVEVAQAGIEANPEGCIAWAESHNGPFTRRLRAAGLLR